MHISTADVGEAKATLYRHYALLKTCIRNNLRSLKSSRCTAKWAK